MDLYLRLTKLVFFAAVMIIILVAGTGCLVIPFGSEITADEVERIREGVTTRHDIEQMLGKPNVLDEPEFSVYLLTENKIFWMIGGIGGGTGGLYVGETYALAFIFDSDEVVKEFKYDTSVIIDSDRYLSLDKQFPDHSFVLGEGYINPIVDVSDDGSWVTVLTDKKLLLHEIDNETQEMEVPRPMSNLFSEEQFSFGDCVGRFLPDKGKGWVENIEWLINGESNKENFVSFAIERFASDDEDDISLDHKKCKQSGLLDISDDSTLLAVGNREMLSLWSIYNGKALNHANAVMPIKRISFSPDSKYLISIGRKDKRLLYSSEDKPPRFSSKEPGSVVNIWSVPSLQNVAKLERNITPYAATFSDNGKFFSIAFDSHIEIWERIDSSSNTAYTKARAFQLKKVIPKPVIPSVHSSQSRGLNYRKSVESLSFSLDGKLLMSIDKLLYIWDTSNGKLLALIDRPMGILDAEFYKEEYIIVAGRAKIPFWPPGGFNGVKIWKLPLSSVLNQ